ncbi:MAG: hypothetical protein Q7T66_09770 [Herminiimonas sp.]|uniref:hypothetical protein n=1 Tax=Herminiimonas sp. TaxID=1926289 RepID=UPI0027226A49|nr:hypothetical protein [Herminiimonas sp.]MDO9420938.1 hypothetical protein [Herminiimonas sp.]
MGFLSTLLPIRESAFVAMMKSLAAPISMLLGTLSKIIESYADLLKKYAILVNKKGEPQFALFI